VCSERASPIGVASIAKEVGFRGSVVAVDLERGALYVGTQNAYGNPAPYGSSPSVVALGLGSGELLGAVASPEHDVGTAPTDDDGFSASPNLFSAEVDGAPRDLVGVGQTSGIFWAPDRDTSEEVWRAPNSSSGPRRRSSRRSSCRGRLLGRSVS